MKQTQLLKGVLEGCVLSIIYSEEVYGYQLVQLLKNAGFSDIVGGTIYPLLQKLEKNQWITSTSKPSPDGPDRRYFTITSKGIEFLQEFELQWQQLKKNVDGILTKKENDYE